LRFHRLCVQKYQVDLLCRAKDKQTVFCVEPVPMCVMHAEESLLLIALVWQRVCSAISQSNETFVLIGRCAGCVVNGDWLGDSH
jgi:hypothetical protein